jgi:uncharacterized pyridoxal phosphate-containing UPF0001 family protein
MKELVEMVDSHEFANMNFVRICGVMGMATFTSNKDQVSREFSYLTDCFNNLKNRYFEESPHFREISMGMSGDFEIAINEGRTMVRIGSLIFGGREIFVY